MTYDLNVSVFTDLQSHHRLYLALGTVAVGLTAWIAVEFALTERAARALTASAADSASLINTALRGTHKNGDDGLLMQARLLLSNAREAANAAKQTVQDANRIAKAQEKPTAALTASSVALVDAGRETVARLGASIDSLNGVVADVRTQTLPRVNAGVDALGAGIHTLDATAGSLNGLITDLRPTARSITSMVDEATVTLRSVNGAVVTANGLLADPDLQGIVHNFDATSANLTLITSDVHQMLNPKSRSFWQALSMTAAQSLLGSAAGPLISHWFPLGINVKNTVVTK